MLNLGLDGRCQPGTKPPDNIDNEQLHEDRLPKIEKVSENFWMIHQDKRSL